MQFHVNHLFMLSFILFSKSVFCQTEGKRSNFFIKGEIIGRDTGTIILWYKDKDNQVRNDTVQLQNGKFNFSGTTNRVCEALLWADPDKRDYDNSSMIRFLLEPKTIIIIGKKNREAKALIKGSAAETEKENWDQQKSSLLTSKAQNIERIDSLFKVFKASKDAVFREKVNQLFKQRDSINEGIKAMDIKYIKGHPTSYLSAYLLSKHVRKLPVDSIQLYYTSLLGEVKKSSVAHDVLAYVYPKTDDNDFRKANPLIDAKFDERLRNIKSVHDLSLKDTMGNTINLNLFKGKYLVIDFWGSTCEPCIENIPALNKLIKTFNPDSIQFVSISIDRNVINWKNAIIKYKFKGLQVSDLQGFNGLAAVYCKALWVPRYIIADRNGKIINYEAPHPKEPEFKKLLDNLIK